MYRLSILLVLFLTGCTTALWSPNYEQEKLTGFYIDKSRDTLLVISENNGYIFNVSPDTAEALILSRDILFKPTFRDFKLDSKNNVTGKITLTVIDKQLSKEDENQLLSIGFKPNQYNNLFEYSVSLEGKRYEVEGPLPFHKLEGNFVVMIEVPDTMVDVASKIVATPLTISYDAVVVVPTVFVMVLIMASGSP